MTAVVDSLAGMVEIFVAAAAVAAGFANTSLAYYVERLSD
jgi:hypothetical protein